MQKWLNQEDMEQCLQGNFRQTKWNRSEAEENFYENEADAALKKSVNLLVNNGKMSQTEYENFLEIWNEDKERGKAYIEMVSHYLGSK